MKIRTGEECPAVGKRAQEIMGVLAESVTPEHEPEWDDRIELSALAAVLARLFCFARDIEPTEDLLNGLGHTIAKAMYDYIQEYANAPRN